ncbi:hypothetical protein WN55_07352 [Dufourea novaeangliae]|uniref:Uncharacterized protein n=1 Tax=Dufourea novaeangliae TaxID=178035 RepID=A0A154PRZ5_DUFNO|nr:hypothetical protein WN55_07352 [Dufourea novaeangliae]
MCHRNADWTRSLSTVLLALRLPEEFFLPDDLSPDPKIFLEEHREHMRLVRPVPAAHHSKRRAFVFKALHECSHVFMRNMAKKALERPYTGLHRVLSRPSDRVFSIDVNGTSKKLSIGLLKPAYLDNPSLDDTVENDSSLCSSGPAKLRTYARKCASFNM